MYTGFYALNGLDLFGKPLYALFTFTLFHSNAAAAHSSVYNRREQASEPPPERKARALHSRYLVMISYSPKISAWRVTQ